MVGGHVICVLHRVTWYAEWEEGQEEDGQQEETGYQQVADPPRPDPAGVLLVKTRVCNKTTMWLVSVMFGHYETALLYSFYIYIY